MPGQQHLQNNNFGFLGQNIMMRHVCSELTGDIVISLNSEPSFCVTSRLVYGVLLMLILFPHRIRLDLAYLKVKRSLPWHLRSTLSPLNVNGKIKLRRYKRRCPWCFCATASSLSSFSHSAPSADLVRRLFNPQDLLILRTFIQNMSLFQANTPNIDEQMVHFF